MAKILRFTNNTIIHQRNYKVTRIFTILNIKDGKIQIHLMPHNIFSNSIKNILGGVSNTAPITVCLNDDYYLPLLRMTIRNKKQIIKDIELRTTDELQLINIKDDLQFRLDLYMVITNKERFYIHNGKIQVNNRKRH